MLQNPKKLDRYCQTADEPDICQNESDSCQNQSDSCQNESDSCQNESEDSTKVQIPQSTNPNKVQRSQSTNPVKIQRSQSTNNIMPRRVTCRIKDGKSENSTQEALCCKNIRKGSLPLRNKHTPYGPYNIPHMVLCTKQGPDNA